MPQRHPAGVTVLTRLTTTPIPWQLNHVGFWSRSIRSRLDVIYEKTEDSSLQRERDFALIAQRLLLRLNRKRGRSRLAAARQKTVTGRSVPARRLG